ncbi:MAG: GNAT family N-acetyltransferase [archaeon]|nr:GNAT family N-acetyltransferase [archaeon]
MDGKFEYIIRPCRYEELSKVIEINESTLPENYPTYFYEQILEKYPESFMVAELKEVPGKIIGYIMWRCERGISSYGISLVKKGHLVSIAISEEYRRNQVASNLLRESMKRINMVSKPDEYVLEVRVSNSGAVDLYLQGFNYNKTRIIERYYRDGEDAYYMTLKADKFDPN